MIMFLLIFVVFIHYHKIGKYKRKHRWNFSVGILQWHLLTKFSIAKSIGKYWKEYSYGTYRGNRSGRRNKKNKIQTIQWHVRFTDEVTNEINPMVKFIREYVDGKLLSVYINNIMKGITVILKKANRTVTWHFYQQNCRWRYHWNNFVDPSIGDI